jgi:hypothetical protein
MITAEANPMTVIDRTFHDLLETQKWLESYNQQPKVKTIRVIISDEDPEALDDYHASLSPEQLAEIDAGIERGLADVDAGRVTTYSQQFLDDLGTEIDKKIANQTQ